MEQELVSEVQDLMFWGERDAGLKQLGGVETGGVKVWAEVAAGCTVVVCEVSAQGWPAA